MDEKKVRSIRLDDETNEKFKSLCAELGGQSECMNSLINAYKLNRSKSILTDMSADITEFEGLVNRIVSAYTHALALKQDAEINAKETVERELKAKDDVISKFTEDLKVAEQSSKELKETHNAEVKELTEKMNEALKEKTNLENDIIHLKEENEKSNTIISDKIDIIENLKSRVPKVESLNQQIAVLNSTIDNLKNDIVSLNSTISELNSKNNSLEQTISKLNADAEFEKEKSKFAIDKAVLEEQKKSAVENKELHKEINNLRKQILELTQQIAVK